jgi:hypothetical protein
MAVILRRNPTINRTAFKRPNPPVQRDREKRHAARYPIR